MADTEHKVDSRVRIISGVVLLIWLVLAFILGANNTYVRAPGTLPLPILAGVLVPILIFLIAFWTVGRFRDYVMSIDLPTAAGIQGWRVAGLGFIAMYVYGVLPGLFAWPAGLGDAVIGITAPFVVLALRRRPAFAAGKLFAIWNLLGILDLVVAMSLGALSSILGVGLSAGITTFPMAEMPLVLVPTFFVPLFVILHLTSLIQASRLAAAGEVCVWTEPEIKCVPVETMHRA